MEGIAASLKLSCICGILQHGCHEMHLVQEVLGWRSTESMFDFDHQHLLAASLPVSAKPTSYAAQHSHNLGADSTLLFVQVHDKGI